MWFNVLLPNLILLVYQARIYSRKILDHGTDFSEVEASVYFNFLPDRPLLQKVILHMIFDVQTNHESERVCKQIS